MILLRRKKESADKPGSVVGNHSSGMRVAAQLKRPTRKHARAARRGFRRLLPYLALLQAGFAVPSPLPSTRCALTAPFHPCRRARARLGGVFSVALSVGSRPLGVTQRLTLWSPDFPHAAASAAPFGQRRRHTTRDHLGDSDLACARSSASFTNWSARALCSRRTESNVT